MLVNIILQILTSSGRSPDSICINQTNGAAFVCVRLCRCITYKKLRRCRRLQTVSMKNASTALRTCCLHRLCNSMTEIELSARYERKKVCSKPRSKARRRAPRQDGRSPNPDIPKRRSCSTRCPGIGYRGPRDPWQILRCTRYF